MGVMQVMRSLLMAQPHRESIVGENGIATFNDDFKGLMKLSVPFTPIQAAGTPSPENPLLISGWTGAEIDATGINIFDVNQLVFNKSGYMLQKTTGAIISGSGYKTTEAFYPCKQFAGRTIISNYVGTTSSGTYPTFAFYSDAAEGTCVGTYQKASSGAATMTVNVPSTARYMRICLTSGWVVSNGYILLGNIVPSPVPKFGTRIPITFTDPSTGDPLTVYGGTLTLNEDGSADLVKSWEYNIVKGTETIRVNSWTSGTFDIRYASGPDFISSGSGGAYLKCNILKSRQAEYALKTEGACNTVGGSYRYFIFRDTATFGTTVAECKEKLQEMYENGTPLVFCAVLPTAKRITYHFDNVGQLKSFIGQNNVWTDLNGDPTVGYWKHG